MNGSGHISTHILDTALGKPAATVGVTLHLLQRDQEQDTWVELNRSHTDSDGRCRAMLPESTPLQAGTYRLRFDTGVYFSNLGLRGLYPCVEIIFEVADAAQNYHIPLLLTPNGYTTYRGS